ncbi:MAG: hypothetical protein K2J15_04905 [Muribaculaceae bacterium]|nr:hypothetical protein [Muribaculaceae bacterium]
MKKLSLFLAMLLCFSVVKAEQFDELDLLGGWELVSYEGTYPFFTEPYNHLDFVAAECKFLYLGDIYWNVDGGNKITLPGLDQPLFDKDFNGGIGSANGMFYKDRKNWIDSDQMNPDDDCILLDNFFIAGGNKLNLVPSQHSNSDFYIPALKFIIETLNDTEILLKSYDGKFKVTYKRITGVSDVKSINDESNAVDSKTYYNLDGTKTNNPLNGIYIEKTPSAVKKIVVK